MRFHIVCQLSPQDPYTPTHQDGEAVLPVLLWDGSHPHRLREDIWLQLSQRGLALPPASSDLLCAALSVYAADLKIPRKAAENRWTRDLVLHLPVLEMDRWMAAKATLVQLLSFLTGDQWEIVLRPRAFANGVTAIHVPKSLPFEAPDVACLFSGGLDSFAGAVDLLGSEQKVTLIGHYGHGSVSFPQREAYNYLDGHYGKQVQQLSFFATPASMDSENEDSQRSRSFLFLALGIVVCSAFDHHPALVVAENGFISLNVPMTAARSGSLSTRTTHPYYIKLYREILNCLAIDVVLHLPYKFTTKGEALRRCRPQDIFRQGITKTVSCAHPGVGRHEHGDPKEHCGYCLPCLIRRASLRAADCAGLEKYFVDVLTTPPPRTSEKSLDLMAMQLAIERVRGARPYRFMFEASKAGPLPTDPDAMKDYADVYFRGLEEVRVFLED